MSDIGGLDFKHGQPSPIEETDFSLDIQEEDAVAIEVKEVRELKEGTQSVAAIGNAILEREDWTPAELAQTLRGNLDVKVSASWQTEGKGAKIAISTYQFEGKKYYKIPINWEVTRPDGSQVKLRQWIYTSVRCGSQYGDPDFPQQEQYRAYMAARVFRETTLNAFDTKAGNQLEARINQLKERSLVVANFYEPNQLGVFSAADATFGERARTLYRDIPKFKFHWSMSWAEGPALVAHLAKRQFDAIREGNLPTMTHEFTEKELPKFVLDREGQRVIREQQERFDRLVEAKDKADLERVFREEANVDPRYEQLREECKDQGISSREYQEKFGELFSGEDADKIWGHEMFHISPHDFRQYLNAQIPKTVKEIRDSLQQLKKPEELRGQVLQLNCALDAKDANPIVRQMVEALSEIEKNFRKLDEGLQRHEKLLQAEKNLSKLTRFAGALRPGHLEERFIRREQEARKRDNLRSAIREAREAIARAERLLPSAPHISP